MNVVQRLFNLAFWRAGWRALRSQNSSSGPGIVTDEVPSSKPLTGSAPTAFLSTGEEWKWRGDA